MASNLGFLNKNLFRKYPIQASSTAASVDGFAFPMDVIASVSITTTLALSNLSICQARLQNGYVSVVIEHIAENPDDNVVIGCFTAQIVSDFQAVRMTSFVPFIDGYMTFGNASNIAGYNNLFNFTSPNAALELSTVFIYTPPLVTSLKTQYGSVAGDVTFGNLTNLILETSDSPSNIFTLTAASTTGLESVADTSSQLGNCPTPVITSINNAVPYSPDSTSANDYNIYLIGVDPIIFDQDTSTASLNIVTSIDLATLCTQSAQLLPPLNPNYLVERTDGFDGTTRYYSRSQTPVINLYTESAPEYLVWPNFVRTYIAQSTVSATGSVTILNGTTSPIIDSGQTASVQMIRIQTATGTATVDFKINSTTVLSGIAVTDDGIVMLTPAGSSTFAPTSNFDLNVTAVSGTVAITTTVLYNLILS